MTVKELKEALNDMPEDNIVQIYVPHKDIGYEIEFIEKGDESIISEKDYVFINVR